MAMLIAAADLGIGSGHSAVADQEIEKRLQRAWVQPVVETLGAAPSKPRLVLAIASDAQGGPRTSLAHSRESERRSRHPPAAPRFCFVAEAALSASLLLFRTIRQRQLA
jgi:hypothetical protein